VAAGYGIALALMVAVVAAIFALALGGTAPAAAPEPTAAPACVWDDEINRTLAELGENGARWELKPLSNAHGYVDPDRRVAVVDSNAPCAMVSSIVRHEWAHLRQIELYGSWPAAITRAGSMARAEVIADCASKELGSRHTPYVDGKCSTADLAEAHLLIDRH
jgi:hypothetical protein